jgi:hypothetical protein
MIANAQDIAAQYLMQETVFFEKFFKIKKVFFNI